MQKNQRLLWPDIAKGIGILLVVFGHTISPKMRSDYWGFDFFSTWLETVHMPLFFFVSGWIFEIKAEKYMDNRVKTVYSKFCRLMIPYFSFSILYYIFVNIALRWSFTAPFFAMSTGVYQKYTLYQSVFQILTFENSMAPNLWFIYVLFIVTMLNVLLPQPMKRLSTLTVLFLLPFIDLWFAMPTLISRFQKYAVFFSLARILFHAAQNTIAIQQGNRMIKTSCRIYIYMCVYILAVVLYLYCHRRNIFDNMLLMHLELLIKSILSFFGTIFICYCSLHISKLPVVSTALSYLGRKSFPIYLIHVPILTPTIVTACIIFIPSMPIILDCIFGLIAGVVIPLLVSSLVIEKIPILNTALFGATYKR